MELESLLDECLPQWLTHHSGATRDLLPLPWLGVEARTAEHLISWRGERDENWGADLVLQADQWLGLVVRTLNAQVKATAAWWQPRAPQAEALRSLWLSGYDCLAAGLDISAEDWAAYLGHHRIDYHGEVALVAQPLTWERVEPALPPPSACAVLAAEDVCSGSALHYVLHPEQALCDRPELLLDRVSAKVRIRPFERVQFARELLKRDLVRVVRSAELVRVNGKAVLNGLFGIEKPSQQVQCKDGKGRAALRLIMNLQPINAIMREFKGDTGTLPLMARMSSVVVEQDGVLECSYEDLRGCFYLMRLAPEWARYFAFNMAFTAEELVLESTEPSTEPLYIGSQVIPMGWRNAVGLVQAIHKRLLWASGMARPLSANLPACREVRADRPLPMLSLRNPLYSQTWQVYIDDFDTLELVAAGEPERDTLSDWQTSAREVYDYYSRPLDARDVH
eukprot:5587301-Amphidinium_carterae.2